MEIHGSPLPHPKMWSYLLLYNEKVSFPEIVTFKTYLYFFKVNDLPTIKFQTFLKSYKKNFGFVSP